MLRSLRARIEDRMRQGSVHAFRSGINLFCRCAQYTAVNGRETLDRGQIAIQRDARENGVYQRPETRARRPVAARGSSTISTGGSFKSGDSFAGGFRHLSHGFH